MNMPYSEEDHIEGGPAKYAYRTKKAQLDCADKQIRDIIREMEVEIRNTQEYEQKLLDRQTPNDTPASFSLTLGPSLMSVPLRRRLLLRFRRRGLARLRRRVDQVPQAALEALGHTGFVNNLWFRRLPRQSHAS